MATRGRQAAGGSWADNRESWGDWPFTPTSGQEMGREHRSDERLLLDYLGGDESSFCALINRYHLSLLRFLSRVLGNVACAEDVAQETYLRLHRAAGRFP